MKRIDVTELIITCESCGNVEKFRITSQDNCDEIFRNFKCKNNCGRDLYSFITVGTVARQQMPYQVNLAAAAN
ncbi:MAG: hypothetical protein ACOY90_17290 [Candidatus Zhuqueibacterota bacterium]